MNWNSEKTEVVLMSLLLLIMFSCIEMVLLAIIYMCLDLVGVYDYSLLQNYVDNILKIFSICIGVTALGIIGVASWIGFKE